MIDKKSAKGAVTLYILVCVMFFIVALVNVEIHLNNKMKSLDAEYQKIQSSYQQDANEVYSQKISQN